MKLRKTEEIKARVDAETKRAVVRFAEQRGLDPSDIVRAAIRRLLKNDSKPARCLV